jgi:hypothetical protein
VKYGLRASDRQVSRISWTNVITGALPCSSPVSAGERPVCGTRVCAGGQAGAGDQRFLAEISDPDPLKGNRRAYVPDGTTNSEVAAS